MPEVGGIGIAITGMEEVEKKLDTSSKNIIQEAAKELHLSGEKVMGDSKENYVPVATGSLRASGWVKLPEVKMNEVIIELGFGGPAAPYALVTHENPRAGKTEGVSPQGHKYPRTQAGKPTWATHGEWKYLETPLKKHQRDIEKNLFDKIERLIRRA